MITREEVRKLSALAGLEITEEELAGLAGDLSEVIRFADAIEKAAAHLDFECAGPENCLREDCLVPSLFQQEVLQNAPAQYRGFFLVPETSWKKV